MYSPCTPQINQHLQWPLHIGSSPNRILPFLKGVTSIVETPQTWIWGATFFLNIYIFKQILYMLNQIYIHYINTLFVLESFIISCWLLKGKKIGIGIGIGQFARKKSVSESATKNHDRCITTLYTEGLIVSWLFLSIFPGLRVIHLNGDASFAPGCQRDGPRLHICHAKTSAHDHQWNG